MIYGSVCSGIEAATAAWHPLGWTPAWFAEIDKFPSAVLAHHYPEVKNHGDFTTIGSDAGPIDVLVGGTPCQDFSIAGLREGIHGERGSLTLEFFKLADRLRPRWLVWENVPGVMSLDRGRTFGAILGGLGQLGYGFAYRILDAQYCGVPQRRRRVFVVGYRGDWRRAAAVLFESHGLSGHSAPGREARQDATHAVAPSLTSSGRGVARAGDSRGQDPVVAHALSSSNSRIDYETETFITHALSAEGADASEDGTGRGTPLIAIPILEAGARTGVSTRDARAGIGIGDDGDPMFTLQAGHQHAIAFSGKDYGADAGEVCPALRSMNHDGSHANGGGQVAMALAIRGRDGVPQIEMGDEAANAILTNGGRGGIGVGATLHGMAVRRLTPLECERLQGFPDNFTRIPLRRYSKRTVTRLRPPDRWERAADGGWWLMAADGLRYKALGNSMAVPCMRWIGERIAMVDAL